MTRKVTKTYPEFLAFRELFKILEKKIQKRKKTYVDSKKFINEFESKTDRFSDYLFDNFFTDLLITFGN